MSWRVASVWPAPGAAWSGGLAVGEADISEAIIGVSELIMVAGGAEVAFLSSLICSLSRAISWLFSRR